MHNCHEHQVHLSDPQTITESSENRITSVGHSHEIEKASQNTAGIVKVVDHTESIDPLEALSANQGRILAEALREVVHYNKDETINQTLDAALGYLSTRLTASYSTLALAQANVYKHAEASLIYVVNDAEVQNCGLYTIQGGELVKAPWDALSSAITSEPFEVLQRIMTLPADTTVEYQGNVYFSLATIGKAITDGQTEISEIIQTLANANRLLSRYILTDSGKTQEQVNTETWSELNLKADQTYVDEKLNLKANSVNVDAALALKAPQSNTYTKGEVDASLTAIAGGHKAYTTLALAQAAQGTLPANTIVEVTNDPTASNNGTYQWNGTTLTKSAYDPLTQAKADATTKANAAQANAKDYSDQKIKTFSIYNNMDTYVETVLDVNGFTRIKMQTKAGQAYFYDSRIDENGQSIADLSAIVKGVEIYKKIQGTATVILDVNGFTRIKEQNVTTGQFISYVGVKQKTLIAGTGISILETPETIEISAGEISYGTPTEYVLALVIGQSNNTTAGGNEAEAPLLPESVCLIWDNTYNTLGDINDSPQKASVVPAMALNFYKQTGMGLIVVNSAVGSSAMSELAASISGRSWDVTGTLRQPAIDRLNACKSYLDSNGYCYQMGFISWSQGEQDGVQIENNVITISDYTTAFTTFIDFIKTNVGTKVPFIITRTGYRAADNAAYKAIRDAQMNFAHTLPNVWMGYTGTTKFFSRDLMSDSVHYNQEGKNIIGTAIGKISAKLSAGVN